MQPSLLPGDARKQLNTEQHWLTWEQQVPCQTFRKGSPRLGGMQLGFQIVAWALRLLKRNRFFESVIIIKRLSILFWNFWHLKQCQTSMNRCVGLPAWERASHGCVKVVYQLKVKDVEYLCASHSLVQFYPCCKAEKQWGRAVGISAWIHIWGEWAAGAGDPTVEARRIMAVVDGLQVCRVPLPPPPQTLQNNHDGPRAPQVLLRFHHWQTAPSQAAWDEKVVTNSEQLYGASGERVWGKKNPSWRAEPCFGCGLVCVLLRVLRVWVNGLSLRTMSGNRHAWLLLWDLDR